MELVVQNLISDFKAGREEVVTPEFRTLLPDLNVQQPQKLLSLDQRLPVDTELRPDLEPQPLGHAPRLGTGHPWVLELPRGQGHRRVQEPLDRVVPANQSLCHRRNTPNIHMPNKHPGNLRAFILY